MIFLRSLIFIIVLVLTALILFGLFVPLLFLPQRCTIFISQFWWGIACYSLSFICGVKIVIKGLENLPKDSNVIIASNHQSALETLLLGRFVKAPMFLLKKELIYLPVIGWFLYKMGAIWIDRSKGVSSLKDSTKQANKALLKKRDLIIFPEGTRVKLGEVRKYNPGIYMIYKLGLAPVIPVTVNTGRVWPKGSFLKYPGVCTLEFMSPIEQGLNKEEFMTKLENLIRSKS